MNNGRYVAEIGDEGQLFSETDNATKNSDIKNYYFTCKINC